MVVSRKLVVCPTCHSSMMQRTMNSEAFSPNLVLVVLTCRGCLGGTGDTRVLCHPFVLRVGSQRFVGLHARRRFWEKTVVW